MKRNNKKGFTIVELVIVIAVIAILAAVLIPTFSSVIKKAKVNNDIQLVRNLNTALATDNKKHATMQDALDSAAEFGYDVAKINASATDNEILWDSVNDVFCYLNTEKNALEYIPSSVADDDKLSVNSYLLWKISKTVDPTYSTYYTGDATTFTGENAITKGFDAGTTKGITAIEYKNTGTEQKVVIRTNSQFTNLTIDAPQDNVNHYGNAGKVTITAVKPESYHLYGAANEIALTSGKVEIEEGSFVGKVVSTGGSVVVKGVIATEVIGNDITVTGNGTNGLTTDSVIKVGTAETLMNLAYAQSTGVFGNNSLKIELTADIDLTGRTWVPFGAANYFFEGEINGKGHTIKGIKNDGYKREEGTHKILSSTNKVQDPFGLISCAVGTIKISNLTVEVDIQEGGESVGGFIGNYQKKTYQDVLEFNSCTVKGSISAKKKVGGFVGTTYFSTRNTTTENGEEVAVQWAVDSYSTSNKTSFINCHSNVAIIAEARAGGFIGANNSYKTIFTNCSFEKSVKVTSQDSSKTGNWAVGGYIGYETSDPQQYNPKGIEMSGTYADYIVNNNKSSVEIIFTSCKSTGSISGNADTGYSKAYIGRNDKSAIVSGLGDTPNISTEKALEKMEN